MSNKQQSDEPQHDLAKALAEFSRALAEMIRQEVRNVLQEQLQSQPQPVKEPDPPRTNQSQGRYLNTQQAAEWVGMSKRTLENWRVTGGGPKFVKFGWVVRYSIDELEQFAAANRLASTSQVSSFNARIQQARRGHQEG